MIAEIELYVKPRKVRQSKDTGKVRLAFPAQRLNRQEHAVEASLFQPPQIDGFQLSRYRSHGAMRAVS